MVTVQLDPWATAETARPSGAARRTATWSGPAVHRASEIGPRRAASGISSRAVVSNTTQTASPRRKTAAPIGDGQAKDRLTLAGVATAETATAWTGAAAGSAAAGAVA